MNDELKHYGIKGMKWGVRRYQPYPKGSRNAGKFIDVNRQKNVSNQNGSKSSKVTKDSGVLSNAKATVQSKGRELSMARAQREIKNLSTKDAKKVLSRAQLENSMKRLSSTRNVGDKQAKRDYLNRASMSDQELKRKVDRLQISENMRQEARKANKEVIDIGKKAAAYAAPLAISYVVPKISGMDGSVPQESLAKSAKAAAEFIDNLI